MSRFDIILATVPMVADEPNLDWLGPILATTGSVIVALIGAASIIWRRRQDRQEELADKDAESQRAVQPKVTDGWEEVRKARAEATTYYNLYRFFESAFYTTRNALRAVVQWVRVDRPDHVFEKDVVDALALKPPDTPSE